MKKCLEFSQKKRYNTQKDAETAILLLDNQNLRTYRCETCDGWHLTSNNFKKLIRLDKLLLNGYSEYYA